MKSTIGLALIAGLATPVFAQTPNSAQDPAQAHIDSTFGRMDENADGQIDRAEFERFMTARIAAHKARFDAEFSATDTSGDGRIDRKEAAVANPLLADRFATVDTNADGFVTPEEPRAATLAAQQEELPEQ
ncbi:EF-hand domain-containing protein [Rhizorhapis sp. SPR117]|uniref:EF-hand domain-containing protein n=1 Tax=Rhizorhapis sp. SPR117 TaxID=2912611 RepID=UPI001F2FED65|nr:hypothetical protein [Rhizorhapis sp. SPR117]